MLAADTLREPAGVLRRCTLRASFVRGKEEKVNAFRSFFVGAPEVTGERIL